ncbi:MAG TPA: hypothetical protein VM165_18535 [Planctomycetaceae bacterium]|nr:hypothetical protein [Planctomycetaceae bacterium]
MSRIARSLIVAVVATVIAGIGIGAYAIRTALVAEENLQAYLHAHWATIEFLDKTGGRWPGSWTDLQTTRPASDFPWVAQHLTYDFGADPVEIAQQTPDSFTAIVPNQPCYGVEHRVQSLIDAVKAYHSPK